MTIKLSNHTMILITIPTKWLIPRALYSQRHEKHASSRFKPQKGKRQHSITETSNLTEPSPHLYQVTLTHNHLNPTHPINFRKPRKILNAAKQSHINASKIEHFKAEKPNPRRFNSQLNTSNRKIGIDLAYSLTKYTYLEELRVGAEHHTRSYKQGK